MLSVPLPASQSRDQVSSAAGSSGALLAKQRSFDVAENREGGTYGFSGHENRPSSRQKSQSQQPLPTPLARSYSFMQRREKYHQYQDEDDSMHEKYFLGTPGSGGGGGSSSGGGGCSSGGGIGVGKNELCWKTSGVNMYICVQCSSIPAFFVVELKVHCH